MLYYYVVYRWWGGDEVGTRTLHMQHRYVKSSILMTAGDMAIHLERSHATGDEEDTPAYVVHMSNTTKATYYEADEGDKCDLLATIGSLKPHVASAT